MRNKLVEELMRRDDLTEHQAVTWIQSVADEFVLNDDIEEILMEEFELEPDFALDFLEFLR